MFTGQNIITGLPEELTKVVTFLNGKAAKGDFVFSDSFSDWEDAEGIIASLGSRIDEGEYFFAVGLAYLAGINDGKLTFPENANVWRWAWSLDILAKVGDWEPDYLARVVNSIPKGKDGIENLLKRAVQTYGQVNFDRGVAILKEMPQYDESVGAGLMENNFERYVKEFTPQENPEGFIGSFSFTYQMRKKDVEAAFDMIEALTYVNEVSLMTFFLKAYKDLGIERKTRCEDLIRGLLATSDTNKYVMPVANWALRQNKTTGFLEECILLLVKGLGENSEVSLVTIDHAIGIHHDNLEFIGRLFLCVAENISPLAILKMEGCLHGLSKNKEIFLEFVLAFVIHPKGMYRIAGRRLWDEYHLEQSDFEASSLDETLQCVFVISMLQDFGNPETRLPKLLPLLSTGTEKVKSVLMRFLRPYLDDYMGHVITALDRLSIDTEETKAIRRYYENRSKALEARWKMKELDPTWTDYRAYSEAVRMQNGHMQDQMKEAEKQHKPMWKDFMNTVVLARGGGWRNPDGTTQHLPRISFSMPSRQLAESLSPKEQDEWFNELLKDWDDTTGNH